MILTTAVLLGYFIFTSGLVYEATGSEVTDRLVVPYNLALSGERTGLTGIYTEDDQRVAEWLVETDMPVVCDGNMGMLLRSYGFSKAVMMTTGLDNGVFREGPHLVAFSTWNIETGKAVVDARSAGMRTVDRLPEIDREKYSEVFRSGKAVVYEYGDEITYNIYPVDLAFWNRVFSEHRWKETN